MYRKRAIKIILSVLVTLSLLWLVSRILLIKRTDGITTMQNLYAQEEDTVDVLIIGSSHSGMNLDAAALWEDYGISSYALWGSIQPFWNSYYFLAEALKTQSPEVVVLDVYAAYSADFEYSDDARQVTNVQGMKFSLNKIRAILVSSPSERWSDMLLGFPLWHSRYSEITEDDFQHFPWTTDLINEKGTGCRYGIGGYTIEDVSGITETAELNEKEEKWLRKIIELCQEENISLELIKTPTTNRAVQQPYYNTVAEIAEEYGVSFHNLNGIDAETGITEEDYWTDGHLNTSGARKTSVWLAEYLLGNYALTDHRGDAAYESWEVNARETNNSYLTAITDTEDYFKELSTRDLTVFVTKNSSWESTEEYETLLNCLDTVGISSEEIRNSGGGDWILDSTSGGTLTNQYFGGLYSEFEFDGVIFSADFSQGTGIRIDGTEYYTLHGPGIICLIYDKETDECIDVVEFMQNDNFDMQHVMS